MAKAKIEPKHVTRPIQLLAAWLAALILLEGIFLGAAAVVTEPSWAPGALVIAGILSVPLFLASIFLLQTRYRPEMQEDPYYSKYLDAQTRTVESKASLELADLRSEIFEANARTLEIVESIRNRLASLVISVQNTAIAGDSQIKGELTILEQAIDGISESIEEVKDQTLWERYRIDVNNLLPEYDLIVGALGEASIPIDGTFGASSEKQDVPPVGILTFGSDVEFKDVARLFDLLTEFGITAVSYADRPMYKGRIYIGSYIYKYGEDTYAAVEGEIAAALADPETTTEVFVNLVRAHIQRPAVSESWE